LSSFWGDEAERGGVRHADDGIRIARLKIRDGLSEEEIRNRMASQMSREEKCRRADIIIDNSGEESGLYQYLDQLLKECG